MKVAEFDEECYTVGHRFQIENDSPRNKSYWRKLFEQHPATVLFSLRALSHLDGMKDKYQYCVNRFFQRSNATDVRLDNISGDTKKRSAKRSVEDLYTDHDEDIAEVVLVQLSTPDTKTFLHHEALVSFHQAKLASLRASLDDLAIHHQAATSKQVEFDAFIEANDAREISLICVAIQAGLTVTDEQRAKFETLRALKVAADAERANLSVLESRMREIRQNLAVHTRDMQPSLQFLKEHPKQLSREECVAFLKEFQF